MTIVELTLLQLIYIETILVIIQSGFIKIYHKGASRQGTLNRGSVGWRMSTC